jgi:large subunit ribosomal protein L10
MVSVLNTKICEEISTLFQGIEDCILVNFEGLSVEEVNSLRSSLTDNNISMQVVKVSLADIVLREMGRSEYDHMLKGPTAVIWGGEGILQVSKSVHEFAKKNKKLLIKGGFIGKKSIDTEAVVKLTKVPERPVLLTMVVNSFMDPLYGIVSGVDSLLSSFATLVEALREKKEKKGQDGNPE